MTCECAHEKQHHRADGTCRVAGCECDGYDEPGTDDHGGFRDCTCGHQAVLHREYGRGPCIEKGCGCSGRQQAYYTERDDPAYEAYLRRGGAKSLRGGGDVRVPAHTRDGRPVRTYTRSR